MCCKDAESRVFSLVALDALRLKIFMTIFAPEERLSTSATLIGSSQKKRFDVRIQELVSKVQNPEAFLIKKRFLGSIFGGFTFLSCCVAIFAPIFMKF